MGEVYEAYEAKLHRRVALKIIAPLQPDEHDYEDLFRRFLQEARTLAQVNHPNIVTIYDIDREQGAQFIAMEYVAGLSLKQMLKEVSLSLEEAIPIFAQILEGLTCLHDNHIIHRDLKPHNILLRTDGQIKILDFGIAKQILPGQGEGTSVGVIAGTLPYMAPEVKVGDAASVMSDIWGLGAIFYELIVGRALARVMLDHPNTTEVPWSREDMSRIPHGMRNIINKMCAHSPKDRYQRTTEVSDELKRFRQSRPPVPPEVYDAMVKKVAAIAELKRKEITSEFSFTSIKNNSPMATELRPQNPDRRRSRRKSRRKKLEYYMPYAAMSGVIIAGFGTWFALKGNNNTQPLPAPQPVLPQQITQTTAHTKPESLQPPLILLEPKDNETMWLEPGRIPTLTWSRQLGNGEYEIQIALDTRFKKIIVSEPVAGTTFRPGIVLPEGKYHWRLEPKIPSSPAGGPFRFAVANLTPVELISPSANQSFDAKPSDPSADVDFAWKCKPGAKFYRIQISNDADFKAVSKEQLLQACQYPSHLNAGAYHWRVRMEDAAPAQTAWSEPRSFTVRVTSLPAVAGKPTRGFESTAPKLRRALTTFTLLYRGTPRDLASLHKNLTDVPRLEWQPLKGARGYHLQMALNKDFMPVLAEEKSSTTHLDWRSAVPGKVFWRVRGIGANGEASEFSPRGMVIVNLPTPKLNDSFKLNKDGGKLAVIEWEQVPLAAKYLVQQDTNRSLANAEERLVEEPRAEVEGGSGKYFMRIAAANDAGEAISAFSSTAAITVDSSGIAVPKAVSPGNGARAPSRDGRLSVKFSWSAVPGAEIYSVELSPDPEFSQIIQKLRTPQATFLLKQAQLKGRVYWRVRAESAKGNSEWSTPSFFDVR